MQTTLLLVDDERSILKTLRRLFRREGYDVVTATNGSDALRQLAKVDVSVVVSDYRMPGMSGTELLTQVREQYPDVLRIMLTGQADFGSIIDAINHGAVYKFLVKPWEGDDLVNAVQEAVRHYALVHENRKLMRELGQANEKLERFNVDLEKQVEQKARELVQATYYDALTGLPNRALMADRLNQAILQADRSGQLVAVLVLDIDRFKLVNKSLGHRAGDELLVKLAPRLSRRIRGSDTVARISGDEFGFVLNVNSAEEPALGAKRLLDDLVNPLTISGQEIFVTGSMGISVYPTDGDTGEELLRNAGSAMQHAKEEGRNGFKYYAEELDSRSRRRLSLEAELRRAVERQAFVLYYQPRVCATTDRIVGAEALLRWQHPERGSVSPSEFVPLLEDTGLIEPVGEWVLAEACGAAVRWRAGGLPGVRVSVNLSARQFRQGNFPETVRRIVDGSGLDVASGHLELEITENLLIEDEVRTRGMLEELHESGIQLAIDDFGTGYSSLSYLTRFPIDYLKIDRSFVSQLSHSREAEAVIQAIVSMAHGLRLQVVAEGVETLAQAEFLRGLGCDEFQGYLYSPPCSEAKLVRLLETGDGQIII